MIANVCFVKRPRHYWWDYFTGRYKHCFIAIMDTKLMIYDFTLKGITITEATDDSFIDVEVIQVEIKESRTYHPILTCADFCANIIGVRGIILTPNNLRRKLLWAVHHQYNQQHQKK